MKYRNITKVLAGIVAALALGCSGPKIPNSNASPTIGQEAETAAPAAQRLTQSWTLINFGAPW